MVIVGDVCNVDCERWVGYPVCPRNSKVNNHHRVLIFACCKAYMESQVDGYSTWKQRGEYGQAISSNYGAYIRCIHTESIHTEHGSNSGMLQVKNEVITEGETGMQVGPVRGAIHSRIDTKLLIVCPDTLPPGAELFVQTVMWSTSNVGDSHP
jgi:hypothetical protein